jgi:hypothetical protein
MGSPAGAQSYPGGAYSYQPMAQSQMDTNWQQIVQKLMGPANQYPLNNPSLTAYSQARALYPQDVELARHYMTGTNGRLPFGGPEALASAGAAGSQYPQILANSRQLDLSGRQLLNQAFDPQQRYYNQQVGQLQNQVEASNAAAGIAGTPYGASVAGNDMANYNIAWQNAQLQREAAGMGAASGAFGQAASLVPAAAQAGSLPYTTGYGIASGAANATNNLQNLLAGQAVIGNTAYQLPESVVNMLNSYLNLGQSAAVNSANIGNMGFNQTAQGIGGLLGGANALFGSSSGGLLGGAGGLFGGGAGAGSDIATTIAASADPIAAASSASVPATAALGLLGS